MHFSIPQLWFIAGLALIFLEAVTPGFVIFFFGLAALTLSLVTWLVPSLGHNLATVLFLTLSLIYLFTLRRLAKKTFLGEKESPAQPKSDLVGQRTTVAEAINPPLEGRVEIFGTLWKAAAATALPVGAPVEVTAQNNLTVTVKPLTAPTK